MRVIIESVPDVPALEVREEEEEEPPCRARGSFCRHFNPAKILLLHSIIEPARNEALCSICKLKRRRRGEKVGRKEG